MAQRLADVDDFVGVAGLAFQSLDLASKELTIAVDGSDAGSHQARAQRLIELIQADDSELAFVWDARQRDFYGDSSLGAERRTVTHDEALRALTIVRSLIERIDALLHEPSDTG